MNGRLLLLMFLLWAAALAACTASGEEPGVTATTTSEAPAVPTTESASPTSEIGAEPTALPFPTTPATPTPLPTVSPTPEDAEQLEPAVGPGRVQFYGLSPSGRYLAYAKYAPEDREENPQFPPMTLHVRDLIEGTDCAFDREIITVSVVWRPRLAWRMDGAFLLVDESGGLWGGGPCPADLIPLSLAIPDGARSIAAADLARDQFLLRGTESYFLLRLGENAGVTPLPESVPYGDWSSFAFSPDGAHMAFHLDSGGGLVLNLGAMTVVASVEAAPISGLGDMPAPLWISNAEIILRSNPEIGPVVLNTAGGARSLRVTDAEVGRQFFVVDSVRTDSEVILLLRSHDAGFSAESEKYELYRVAAAGQPGGFTFGDGENLGGGETVTDATDAALSPVGTYLLYTHDSGGISETILRPLAGGPELNVARSPMNVRHAFAPDETLAVIDGDRVKLYRAGEQIGEVDVGLFSLNHLEQWSADSATLIVSGGYSGREERGLFALGAP